MSTVAAENYSGTILDVAPGSSLGPYELLVPVATGGMARVWAARRHDTPSKFVAIKMILPDLAEDAGFQTMFQDEARVGVLLHHPNVCETYEIAEVKGIHYLAMEWVDGTSLLRLLRSRSDGDDGSSVVRLAIDPRVAARIVSDACAGLHAAHELVDEQGRPMKLVHRDATPHNILITADGRVKLSDFGVAKALGNAHATLAGQIKGKMSYMAPEQLCGDPLDRRADIFTLGVCLYESIAGRKAFMGESDPEVMSQIILGQIDPPSTFAANVPPELDQIVMRAMALSPDDRFQTALAMREALEHFIARSGPPVVPADVAMVLEARCGREIHERRDNIRLACSEDGLTEALPASEPPTEIFVHVNEEPSSTRSVPRDRPPPNFWDEQPPSSAAQFGLPPGSSQFGYGPPPSVGGPPVTVRNPAHASGSSGALTSNTNVILLAAGLAALVGIVGVVIAVLLWRRAAEAPDSPAPATQPAQKQGR
jgi:serine/threonine protein kinase